MTFINRLRALSVSRIMLLVTVTVAVLPVLILGIHLYSSAWENGWREIEEKHQLIAQNLAMPISTYVNDHKGMLAIMSETIPMMGLRSKKIQPLIDKTLTSMRGFRSLILLDLNGKIMNSASIGAQYTKKSANIMANEKCYLKIKKTGKWAISNVKPHPITGQPTIFMGQPVRNSKSQIIAVLLGELRIDYIEKIRKQVKFGKKGHSAIVDRSGHVLAHPNPDWMAEIKDLTSWPIVQKMMAGETGVTTFYSSFMKENMVAGYAAVPEIGWGIMVPQPESEVAEQVNRLMRQHVYWGIAGLVIAILLALIVSHWVTGPLDKLAKAARELMHEGLDGNLPSITSHSPKEIKQLGTVLRALISSLQSSRDEVRGFNDSLTQRVDDATCKLREANERLEVAAQSDYLTEIPNRRYFEDCLQQALSRRSGDVDHFCVLLIDVDHFKQINDSYGHAAGDAVLNQVARILEREMRSGDLIARYGGDEFVTYMRCTREIGRQRAEEIHAAIENGTLTWDGKSIRITASVGLYCQVMGADEELKDVLQQADQAMYAAKKQGRNRVIDISEVKSYLNIVNGNVSD
ncbi:diguanylate cyclase/phosphodiesterase (GGDEF & EAL domains) with PAS/PAC sensor(s) [hydrothermal vent metagenome]|uniref:Diguanylate cyclase/phosphodiesterase (GGDEF & EAL domains) with PAS/PAC sensor(S) n=1 Tax=hydrothermal vent metagenome TaxID=652676 RepID=A0A3B1AXE5_9ZZZZ